MGKDLKGNELGKRLYQRKDGRYEARASFNGQSFYCVDEKLSVVRAKLAAAEKGGTSNKKLGQKTLDDYFDDWFTTFKTPKVKITSIPTMKRSYKNYFGSFIGQRKLKDLTYVDLQNVINLHKESGLSDSTVRSAFSLVEQCLDHAEHDGAIQKNPCFDLSVSWESEATEHSWRYLSADERKLLLKWVEDSWYKEMFYFMLCTGVRVGELGALKWTDVDFDRKMIHVNKSLHCAYDHGVKSMQIVKPKTKNSKRDIPFMGECGEMLKAQREKWQALREHLGDRWRSEGDFDNAVFVTTMGSPVTRYIAEKEVRDVVNEINHAEMIKAVKEKRDPVLLENVFPHALRHSFCTMCFERGMDVKTVQSLMGHAHYSTTLDIYTHVTDNHLKEETDKFGFLMS